MISIIWAMDKNGLIGRNNCLPWKLPADLSYFKKNTMDHSIIMGRKTFESIGKPLPGRRNIIMTRDPNFSAEGCAVCHSIEDVLNQGWKDEIFVIGGAEVYSKFLPFADRLYITLIDEVFSGNVFFPNVDLGSWKLVSSIKGEKNEKNPYDYYFKIYEKM